MTRRKSCKKCGKSLRSDNKSGWCGYHYSLYSEASKRARIKYLSKNEQTIPKIYHRANAILREKHREEFNEIYEREKVKALGDSH